MTLAGARDHAVEGAAPVRVRACVAVVRDGRLLLVPHYATDAGPVQWHLPGGRVEFGETLRAAGAREVREETGLEVVVGELLDVSEVVAPERAWHSVTVTFMGREAAAAVGGALAAEAGHAYGSKPPRWFGRGELAAVPCHPPAAVDKLRDALAD